MPYLRACIGLAFFVFVAWLMSSDRKRFPVRVVAWGLGLQVVLALVLMKTTGGVQVIQGLADFVTKLISMQADGTKMVFGGLAEENFADGGWGYAFAFASSGLTVIIFFSALMAVLYHLGVMQLLIWCLAKVMTMLMGVSGAESMAMAANVFVGQTEAPLVVKPYISKFTSSELNAMMTGGFATIAGSVLAVYMGLLSPAIAPHLLTASVLSAPAAFLIAKVMLPESEESATGSHVELRIERTAGNVIEAAANGTSDGLKLWLNVVAMLIAFMGLVSLADWGLAALGDNGPWSIEGGLSLQRIFGWIFSPVAWVMGVEWADCQRFGSLLGTKVAVNEFIAFEQLIKLTAGAEGAGPLVSSRTAAMAAYALCGFANFASIGIQLGGISPLAPERKPEIARLAVRAMIGGAFASWMTATVAGAFLPAPVSILAQVDGYEDCEMQGRLLVRVVSLEDIEGEASASAIFNQANPVQENGEVRIEGLLAGRYRVTLDVVAEEGPPRIDERQLTGVVVDAQEFDSLAVLEIPRVHEVRVLAPELEPGVEFTLTPAPQDEVMAWGPFGAVSGDLDEAGTCTLTLLPAGTYTLTAEGVEGSVQVTVPCDQVEFTPGS